MQQQWWWSENESELGESRTWVPVEYNSEGNA